MTGGQFTKAIFVWAVFMIMSSLVVGATISSGGVVAAYILLGVILVPLTLRWAYLLVRWDAS